MKSKNRSLSEIIPSGKKKDLMAVAVSSEYKNKD